MDHQQLINETMQLYGCSRTQAKAMTFGVRYGNPQTIHQRGDSVRGSIGSVICNLDFASLERRVSLTVGESIDSTYPVHNR